MSQEVIMRNPQDDNKGTLPCTTLVYKRSCELRMTEGITTVRLTQMLFTYNKKPAGIIGLFYQQKYNKIYWQERRHII